MSDKKPRFDINAVKAVGERASQKMSPHPEETTKRNLKCAGRKPVAEPAKNKITLNITDKELEKFLDFCQKNGMKPASVIRYSLTKMNAL
ncbi:hypothetical protein [Sulfurospirillum cavolei]|uniref:hypothetical protein n=1 Tax=Sulfurospirillum cavolei TaxID=366522 RepID=UPI003FA2482D